LLFLAGLMVFFYYYWRIVWIIYDWIRGISCFYRKYVYNIIY
jgi:hypothetical protein